MPSAADHHAASVRYQAFYDEQSRDIGMRAPQPTLGQTVNDYRRETLRTPKRTFLPQNHPLYKVNMRGLPADALQGFEPQVLKAAVKEANNPAHLAPGEIRAINRLDEVGRVKWIDFIGQESFVKQMMRPGRPGREFQDRTWCRRCQWEVLTLMTNTFAHAIVDAMAVRDERR
jgi:hypothetical protein